MTTEPLPAPKPPKPRILQDGRDMFWSIAPLVIACIALGSQWGVPGVAAGYSVGMAISWPLVLWWLVRCRCEAPVDGMLRGGARAIAGYGLCGLASHAASLPLAGEPAPWALLAVAATSLLTIGATLYDIL